VWGGRNVSFQAGSRERVARDVLICLRIKRKTLL
jgi:hypothetical protein